LIEALGAGLQNEWWVSLCCRNNGEKFSQDIDTGSLIKEKAASGAFQRKVLFFLITLKFRECL
jgi:hypothetical protein